MTNRITHHIDPDGNIVIDALLDNNTYGAVIKPRTVNGRANIQKDSIDTHRIDNPKEIKDKNILFMLGHLKNIELRTIYLLLFLFLTFQVHAYDTEIDGLRYDWVSYYNSDKTGGDVKLVGYSNDYLSESLFIPCWVEWNNSKTGKKGRSCQVCTVGANAFQNSSVIKSVDFGCVQDIQSSAFKNCTSLKSIYFSNSIISISSESFSGCSSLSEIHVDDSTPPNIYEKNVFDDNTYLYATVYVPKGCVNRYKNADYWKNFISIREDLSEYSLNISVIGNGSVSYSGNTIKNQTSTFTINEGSSAIIIFSPDSGNKIKSVKVNDIDVTSNVSNSQYTISDISVNTNVEVEFEEIDESPIISFEDTNVKAICVSNWDKNGDGELSEEEAAAVTYLGGAFYENTTITSFEELQFFVGIEDLSSAFRKCSRLKKIVIPNSVKIIGKWAFYGCSALTGTLVIPNSVTSIGESAFEECSGFTGALTIPELVTSIGERAFLGCNGFSGPLTISNSVTSIGKHAFYGCSGLTGSLIIPNSVTSVGGWAFEGCSGLTGTITIPNSVISIGYAAFWGCSNINKVISQIKNPFPIDVNVFRGISPDAILQVPDGTKAQYIEYTGWTEYFKDIIEESENILTYSLSISSTGNGSASFGDSTIKNQTSTFTVNEGSSATITFSPDSGNKIKSVKVNDTDVTSSVSNNSYTINNISSNTTVEVTFEVIPPTTYTLSIKATGNGSASYNSTTIRGKTTSFTVNEGTSVTITFTPDNGYRIASLYVNSDNVTSSISNNKYTISNISSNTTVEVTFEAIPPTTYTLSIKATGSGSASYNSTTIRGKTISFTVNEGTSATITFTPDNGYRIASLYVNSNNVTSSISNNKYTINNISSNTTVEVTFEAIPPTTYTLSIKATGSGSASYNSTTIRGKTISFTVNEGTSATITFTPDNGYRIANLYVNSNNVTSGISNNKYTISNISRNTTVEVMFEAIPVTTYTLSIKSTGGGSASYNGTTIRSKSSSFTVNEGTLVSITLTPDNGYRIKSVKENNTNVTSYVSNSKYTINSISRNTTVEVEFEAIPATTYTLSIKSVGNGSANYNGTVIRGETSVFAVSEGASATVTLYPDEGYSIKSAIVDNTDVLSDIRNNKITLQNISHDILVNIHFENKCDSIIKEFYATQELVDKELDNCRQQLDNLKKLIEKAKEIDADGFSSYEAKYNAYGIALGGIEENAKIQKQAFDSLISSYNEYGIEDLGDEYINGYAERFDYGLKKAKELLMLIHEWEDDINTTYSQLNDELNNLPQTITYTMSVTSSGNGYASYGGVQVRNTTTSFTVNEGTTVTITFVPDNGYQIASVKLNNSDVTAGVSNNSYTINNIKANTILEVVFEAMPTTVIADGVNFNITSQTEQTVSVANGSYGQVLTVPATVTGYGKTWTVTGVEANALSGNTQLAAVIWNPEVAFTATVSNPNLLLYVKAERYAPSTIQNVVVNGTANSIVLTEAQSGNNFYCPQTFTARRISFTHNYKMTTGIGESRGWETIALPFDVQTITHATKGEIVPFANWTSGSTKKPFWLYHLTGNGFKETDAIKAYTPYIISMPNNSQYGSEWLLNGSVTFSATNVTICTTDNVQTATYSSRTFVPNYADRAANEGLYALNAVNDFVTNNSGMTEGSKFVLNMRQVHPFEAYMTSSLNARTYFDIFDDLSTDIKEEFIVHSSQFLADDRVFDLQGRKVEHPSKKGVYILNGKKMVVK